jgi:hypothetical protein
MNLRDLLQGTENYKEIFWPVMAKDGNKIKVLLRVLTDAEHQEAKFSTEKYFKAEEVSTDPIMADEFQNEFFTQALWRALRDPKDKTKPVCDCISDFRVLLTRPIKMQLLDEWIAWEQENSPNPDLMSPEDFDKLLIDLKKKPKETLGNVLSLAIAKKLLLTLVSPQEILQKDNGLPSMPSNPQ